jgi:protein-L-isoaspartate(D-aspartate) O-methyltransferase
VEGHAAGAPYDLILIDGAVEEVPQAIIDQLAEGGRLAAGIAKVAVSELSVGRRAGGGFGLKAFSDASAVLLPGFAKPKGFVFERAE